MTRFPASPMARWLYALTLGAMVATVGCSSFNRSWKALEGAPVPTNSLAGRWQGTWKSSRNGHQDTLRGLFTIETNGLCQARFHARYSRWWMRMSFSYTVPLQLEEKDGTYKFRGDANLGWYAGGLYDYEGSASGTNFFSTYRCRYDDGEFHMQKAPSHFEF